MADNTRFTTEELVGRFEDRRDVKNLMGKYVVSMLLKKESTMLKNFWSKKSDICLGVNEGYYQGTEAIGAYYKSIDKYTIATRDLLVKLFPKQTAGKTQEQLYGIGPFEDRCINNAVVEIAADGKSAKGMWASLGNVTDVTTRGPVSHWVCATYAADFILEDEKWKIWHLLYLEDVRSPAGYNWSEGKNPFAELPDFALMAAVSLAQPNVKKVLRERYSLNRPFTKLPRIPEPYNTFAETFSYGI